MRSSGCGWTCIITERRHCLPAPRLLAAATDWVADSEAGALSISPHPVEQAIP